MSFEKAVIVTVPANETLSEPITVKLRGEGQGAAYGHIVINVGELAEAADLEQSACSHQLRLLRNLGLVTGERRGRSIVYALYDHHVAELLEQALHHVEHLRLGLRDETLRDEA